MKKPASAFAAIVIVSLSACTPAEKKTVLECKVKTGEGSMVTVTLDERIAFDKSLSCIKTEFLTGATACAPNGGFGLSGAGGNADVSAIALNADGYASHEGSVTAYNVTAQEITFSGGKNSSSGGYSEEWKFVSNRNSGDAVLTRGTEATDYLCSGK